jgi:hypothetical protein
MTSETGSAHRPDTSGSEWFPVVRAWVLGAALVALMTAPTITRPMSVGRLDTNDGRFSVWNIAWIGHAILSPDATIFDANIFYPHTGTLAYSELNLVAGVFGLPWYAATRDPLAALNGAAFTALLLAFVSMWALVRYLTGSDPAGLVAATAFTFAPFVGARTAHIQLLMIFVFPLALLALHRLVDRPGLWRGVVLGASLALAALSCGYYGIFTGLMLVTMGLVLARAVAAYWLGLGAAVITTGALVYPIFAAFTRARALSGAADRPQTLDDARVYSANVAAWLASSSFAHEWWLPALAAWQKWSDVLFPGIILIALAVPGGVVMFARSASRRWLFAYALLAGLAVWMSFGPDAGLYAVLYQFVPGMSLIRVPARIGIIVVVALGVAAGFLVARLSARRRWLAPALVVLLVAELGIYNTEWGWPSWPLRTMPPLSPAYRRLAELPRGVLVEFQFPYVSSNFHNHAYPMFWSAYHWQKLVNGYSDLIPPDFYDIALPINGFPDEASFAIMKARDVKYVLWHVDYYKGKPLEVIQERLARYPDALRPIVKTPDVWLYEIVKWPS